MKLCLIPKSSKLITNPEFGVCDKRFANTRPKPERSGRVDWWQDGFQFVKRDTSSCQTTCVATGDGRSSIPVTLLGQN